MATVEPTKTQFGMPGLLDLPEPLLQLILMRAGSGGAAAATSCRSLRRSFRAAFSTPELPARFLLDLYGQSMALFRLYGSPGLRKYLARGPEGAPAAVGAIVVELLQLGAALKPQERFLLTAAAGAGDTLVVRTLLRAGVNAGSCGGRALVAASAAGHVAAMEVLLRAGVSARAENGMPLRAACREGHTAAAQLLLRHGADPRAAASGALAEAARGGHLTLVLELLAAGADPRVDGSRALVEAAAEGHGCVVLALLVAGAQPHARNGLALRQAAAGGHELVVRVLQAAARMDVNGGKDRVSAANDGADGVAAAARPHFAAAALAGSATWRLVSAPPTGQSSIAALHTHPFLFHQHHQDTDGHASSRRPPAPPAMLPAAQQLALPVPYSHQF